MLQEKDGESERRGSLLLRYTMYPDRFRSSDPAVSAPGQHKMGKICLDSSLLFEYMNIYIIYCIRINVLPAG